MDLNNPKKVERLSIQRGYKKRPQEPDAEAVYIHEYIVNENYEKPCLYEEYDRIVDSVYNLKGPEFIIF